MNFPSPFYMSDIYVPDRGDIVWMNLDPVIGHEQGGCRPVLVVSSILYNKKTGLYLCCPITSKVKGYVFEVELPDGSDVTGACLTDQLRTVEWELRGIRKITSVSVDTLREVQTKICRLIGLD